MKTKDDVFDKFQEFKVPLENQIGKKINMLESNNGGDYTSKDLDVFFIEARIKRALTVPYNSQQYGVVARKHMSIIETTKSMIHNIYLTMIGKKHVV